MNIIVRIRHIYGTVVMDPVNANAQLLARIAGTKTLTPETLACARAMGADIEVLGDDVEALKLLIGQRAATLVATTDCQRRSA